MGRGPHFFYQRAEVGAVLNLGMHTKSAAAPVPLGVSLYVCS